MGCKLIRREPVEARMRPCRVVIGAPVFDDLSGMPPRHQPVKVTMPFSSTDTSNVLQHFKLFSLTSPHLVLDHGNATRIEYDGDGLTFLKVIGYCALHTHDLILEINQVLLNISEENPSGYPPHQNIIFLGF